MSDNFDDNEGNDDDDDDDDIVNNKVFSIPRASDSTENKKEDSLVKNTQNIIQIGSAKDSRFKFDVDELKKLIPNKTHGQSIYNICEYLRSRLFFPLPTKKNSKSLKSVSNTPYDSNIRSATIETDKEYFQLGDNVSILLGPTQDYPDKTLVDLDLEVEEARIFAHYFFRQVPTMSYGRATSPKGHYLFIVPSNQVVAGLGKYEWTSDLRSKNKADLVSKLILELRPSGHALVPPSTHPSGEILFWSSENPPLSMSYNKLRSSAAKIAVGALLIRLWSSGMRDNLVSSFSGYALSEGWTLASTLNFMDSLFSCVWPITEIEKKTWRERIVSFDTEIKKRKARGENLSQNIDEKIDSL